MKRIVCGVSAPIADWRVAIALIWNEFRLFQGLIERQIEVGKTARGGWRRWRRGCDHGSDYKTVIVLRASPRAKNMHCRSACSEDRAFEDDSKTTIWFEPVTGGPLYSRSECRALRADLEKSLAN